MLQTGLVEASLLRDLYDGIQAGLVRYPAIDPATFRRALDEALTGR
jgi:hypothetical protein